MQKAKTLFKNEATQITKTTPLQFLSSFITENHSKDVVRLHNYATTEPILHEQPSSTASRRQPSNVGGSSWSVAQRIDMI